MEKTMEKFKRIFVIVIDSVGIGEMPDAERFGDKGTNTFVHTAERCGGLNVPVMNSLGLGDLADIKGTTKVKHPNAYCARLREASNGKDTMTGHWEMMGIYTTKPFITFTDTGFPKELMDELAEKTGHKLIGNKAASGTEILKELGEEQMRDNSLIVYTSADSVLQIAAHEEVTGVQELYRCCEIAREICMKPEYYVGRVIARPYIGKDKDSFKRTPNRHDYAVSPTDTTALNILKDNGYDVISVGKIKDIFNSSGITEAYKSKDNNDGMNITKNLLKKDFTGLCFINLVDFDSQYGHRRDPIGYKHALEGFDSNLDEMLNRLNQDDLVLITADHGNDPTWAGTDHTREYVPILAYSKNINTVSIGKRDTFADIGKTVLENFGLDGLKIGKSFLAEISKK